MKAAFSVEITHTCSFLDDSNDTNLASRVMTHLDSLGGQAASVCARHGLSLVLITGERAGASSDDLQKHPRDGAASFSIFL